MNYVQLTEVDGNPILVRIEALDVIAPATHPLYPKGAVSIITVDGKDIAVRENWEIILKRKWTGAE